MNKTSQSTKDLYKNLIFLVASGIVLIAATVAWFAQNSSTNVDAIGAEVKAYDPVQINYFRCNDSYETLASRDGIPGSVSLYDRINANWTASDSSIDISSMYPGQFFSYKMVVSNTVNNLSLKFKSVTCTATTPPSASASATDTDELLSAVKVDAMATVKPSGGSETERVSLVSTNMYALYSNPTLLTIAGSVSSTDTITFYFDIYLPGGDSSIDYEAFRESGAVISIAEVAAET